jgi:dienelactone hydrolase
VERVNGLVNKKQHNKPENERYDIVGKVFCIKISIHQLEQHCAIKSAIVVFIFIITIAFGTLDHKVFAVEKVEDALLLPISTSKVLLEKVIFPSEDEDLKGGTPTMLEGYVFKPDGPGPFPAIVGLHGCGGLFTAGRMNARFSDWGNRLAALGYVVLFPDSFTPRGIIEACKQKDRRGFSPHRERPRDANGALHWLQRQSTVQKDRIGLMGWSNGGSTLLSTIGASTNKDRGDDFQVAIALYPGCTSFVKKDTWQPRIPLTIFIGEADDWTPAAPCKTLVARAKGQGHQADIVTYSNAYHGFDHPNLPLKIRKGLAFTVNDQGSARVGTDSEGREAVLELVPKLLAQYLQKSPRS